MVIGESQHEEQINVRMKDNSVATTKRKMFAVPSLSDKTQRDGRESRDNVMNDNF